MIISASRRTDIPAFYHQWFMNRIREGFLLQKNPRNPNQIKFVSMKPEDVDVIVFWTRNAAHIINELSHINNCGYKYYFQYTITGYPRNIEKGVPNPHRAIATFKELSNLIGKQKVIWRYDPILLSNQVDLNEHKRLFAKIAEQLSGYTDHVVVSFSDFYRKTTINLNRVENLIYSDITQQSEQLMELTCFMANTATKHGMTIKSCAEVIDTSSAGIQHGKCIDEELIKNVFGIELSGKKDKGQREECGCIKSVDIGIYNTCLHQCAYCYATYNHEISVKNKKKHNPRSPLLLGDIDNQQLKEAIDKVGNQCQLF